MSFFQHRITQVVVFFMIMKIINAMVFLKTSFKLNVSEAWNDIPGIPSTKQHPISFVRPHDVFYFYSMNNDYDAMLGYDSIWTSKILVICSTNMMVYSIGCQPPRSRIAHRGRKGLATKISYGLSAQAWWFPCNEWPQLGWNFSCWFPGRISRFQPYQLSNQWEIAMVVHGWW